MNNIELLRAVTEPFERGGDDYDPFWALMADDVVYENPAGRVNGRQGVIDYFGTVVERFHAAPFSAPTQFIAEGDRVAMSSVEVLTDLGTGEKTGGPWVWLIDMPEGRMAHVVHFMNFANPDLMMRAIRSGFARTPDSVGG